MATPRFFLDETGLKFFAEQLINQMNLKVNEKIITLIDEESTNAEIPSAKAVYDMLQTALAGISGIDFEVVEDLPEPGESGIIYLVKAEPENEESNIYVQWVYVGEKWINLGTSEIDLTGYWSKDELEPISNSAILDLLNEVFGNEPEEPGDPEP